MAEDSYPLFNLPVPNSRDVTFEHTNKPAHIVATVVDKHFCMVKRDGSRYRVPNGTKFFRVSVKPMSVPSSKTPKTDADKVRKELADGECCQACDSLARKPWRHCIPRTNPKNVVVFLAQKPNFSRSLSIQLIDSFAQTDGNAAAKQTPAGSDAIDGISQLQTSTLEQTKATFTSEEDVAVIGEAAALDAPSSQEVSIVSLATHENQIVQLSKK